MYIVKAEAEQIEKIVNMSIRAFETDVNVGGAKGDCPPGFDSAEWHQQMAREGHLYQAMIGKELVGAAIVFPDETKNLMECIEKHFPWAKEFHLDTPCWNERTNAFYKRLGYRIIKVEDGFVFYQKRKSEPNKAVLYIHGKGGSAAECEHYRPLFPECEVIGLDYQTFTPWETGAEIRAAVEGLKAEGKRVIVIANSIGAYFSMNAGIDAMIEKAWFISPIVDMEKLITDMMRGANVTEAELEAKGTIHTAFGEDLSWNYLCYVRSHPIRWTAPTQILYGSRDNQTPFKTIRDFAKTHHAALTVMEEGEHWFHTEEQMRFLDDWIMKENHQ